jgi:hypothetical protein
MKNKSRNFSLGRDNQLNGLIAFGIVMLVALGCTCGRDFGLGNIGTETNTANTVANTSDTTIPVTKPTYKKADASKGEMPSDAELQEIAKTTLLDFNEAVQQEDFTTFYSHICKPWQKQTTPDGLKTTFQGFIDKNISIVSIAALDAEFSPEPEIGRELGYRTLKLAGKYPTSPNVTKFELNYIPEGKDWKLSKIVVDTTSKF